jgi:hypothetical protein
MERHRGARGRNEQDAREKNAPPDHVLILPFALGGTGKTTLLLTITGVPEVPTRRHVARAREPGARRGRLDRNDPPHAAGSRHRRILIERAAGVALPLTGTGLVPERGRTGAAGGRRLLHRVPWWALLEDPPRPIPASVLWV